MLSDAYWKELFLFCLPFFDGGLFLLDEKTDKQTYLGDILTTNNKVDETNVGFQDDKIAQVV